MLVPAHAAEGPDILHVDMDAFFASVEVLDRPELAGRPVIVGGTGERGVVAACTYEARRFGVHSAMPMAVARRRCPGAVVLPGRFGRYCEVSEQLHGILHRYSDLVEGIALDEAFVDVSRAHLVFGSSLSIAESIRGAVRRELGLTCSVGIAANKLLAKLASKDAKPVAGAGGVRPGPGVVTVAPGSVEAYLAGKPIRALWGIGPATARTLRRAGVERVGDLAAIDRVTLRRLVGAAHGDALHDRARGIDDRPVVPSHEAKSVGQERTFAADLVDPGELRTHLARHADAIAARLTEAGLAGRTVTLKVRFGDFRTLTRSITVAAPLSTAAALVRTGGALLAEVDVSPGVRLLGLSVAGLEPSGDPGAEQLRLPLPGAGGDRDESATAGSAEVAEVAWRPLESTIAAVRSRFGRGSLASAALVEPGGLTTSRRGERQWGPNRDGI